MKFYCNGPIKYLIKRKYRQQINIITFHVLRVTMSIAAMNYYMLVLICASINTLNDTDFRKHYGLSFYNQCGNYIITFKCMTVCKSIGYQVFRLNSFCKCSCHDLKTSSILPFFMWRTNGTTRALPKTASPRLYHVVGTLSPPPKDVEETETTYADTQNTTDEGLNLTTIHSGTENVTVVRTSTDMSNDKNSTDTVVTVTST